MVILVLQLFVSISTTARTDLLCLNRVQMSWKLVRFAVYSQSNGWSRAWSVNGVSHVTNIIINLPGFALRLPTQVWVHPTLLISENLVARDIRLTSLTRNYLFSQVRLVLVLLFSIIFHGAYPLFLSSKVFDSLIFFKFIIRLTFFLKDHKGSSFGRHELDLTAIAFI